MTDQNLERFEFLTFGLGWGVLPFLNIGNLGRGRFQRKIIIFSLNILSLKCLWDMDVEKSRALYM